MPSWFLQEISDVTLTGRIKLKSLILPKSQADFIIMQVHSLEKSYLRLATDI